MKRSLYRATTSWSRGNDTKCTAQGPQRTKKREKKLTKNSYTNNNINGTRIEEEDIDREITKIAYSYT